MAIHQRLIRSETEIFDQADNQKFKTSFVYLNLDEALSLLQERFEHLTALGSIFGFFSKIHSPDIPFNQCKRRQQRLERRTNN